LELEKAPDFAEAGANAARTQPRVVLYHPTAGLRDQSGNLFPIASPGTRLHSQTFSFRWARSGTGGEALR